MTIFLDTVGLIALWNLSDQWHTAAKTAFQSLTPNTTRLVSTPFVLLECANDASRRPYRAEVVQLRQQLQANQDLIEPTSAEIHQSWIQFEQGIAGAPGVVDLVSFAIMRRLGITDAFTNDRHFATAGFVTLF